jgi:uncharacterized protein YqgC (DUF456 family)
LYSYAVAMTVLLWTFAVILVLVGLVGIVLPALPGTILILAGLVVAAWADNFARVGPGMLVVIGIIGVASYGIDFVAAALGAKHLGASKRAMAGAAIGTVLGLFFGFIGVIVGPLLGAVAGELTQHRDWKRVGRAGLAAWIGFAIGTAVKVAIAFVMLGLFAVAYLV